MAVIVLDVFRATVERGAILVAVGALDQCGLGA